MGIPNFQYDIFIRKHDKQEVRKMTKIIDLITKIRGLLLLQTSSATPTGQDKPIYAYDTIYSHKEGKKKFYTISYVHNRDVVPGGVIKHGKTIKHTII
jgi:hypothetical protein